METNELRLGNLIFPNITQNNVLISRDVPLKITSLNKETVTLISINDAVKDFAIERDFHLSELKPIPVSEWKIRSN